MEEWREEEKVQERGKGELSQINHQAFLSKLIDRTGKRKKKSEVFCGGGVYQNKQEINDTAKFLLCEQGKNERYHAFCGIG